MCSGACSTSGMTRRTQWLVRYLQAYLELEVEVEGDQSLVGLTEGFRPELAVTLPLLTLPDVGVGVYVNERGYV